MTGAAMAATVEEETRSTEIDRTPDRLKAVFCCPNKTLFQPGKTGRNLRRAGVAELIRRA